MRMQKKKDVTKLGRIPSFSGLLEKRQRSQRRDRAGGAELCSRNTGWGKLQEELSGQQS